MKDYEIEYNSKNIIVLNLSQKRSSFVTQYNFYLVWKINLYNNIQIILIYYKQIIWWDVSSCITQLLMTA